MGEKELPYRETQCAPRTLSSTIRKRSLEVEIASMQGSAQAVYHPITASSSGLKPALLGFRSEKQLSETLLKTHTHTHRYAHTCRLRNVRGQLRQRGTLPGMCLTAGLRSLLPRFRKTRGTKPGNSWTRRGVLVRVLVGLARREGQLGAEMLSSLSKTKQGSPAILERGESPSLHESVSLAAPLPRS